MAKAKNTEPHKPVSLMVPERILLAIDDYCKRTGVTKKHLIVQAIEEKITQLTGERGPCLTQQEQLL